VRLIFQPSEEKFDENGVSGAAEMIQEDALAGIDAKIALHVWVDRPSGQVWFYEGFGLAAVDQFDAWIYGDGGMVRIPTRAATRCLCWDPF
jgi:metal-dependent amidase/aminoacylase/carboxypeptidase family protein